MARPPSLVKGLSYFPTDVDIDQNDKVALIEVQHGTLGFGVLMKLYMKIYGEGYFYKWGEKENLLFSRRISPNNFDMDAFIKDCIKWNIFNEDLFNKYNILSSASIQSVYFEATKRRKMVEVKEEYLLVDKKIVDDYYQHILLVSINVDNNTGSDGVNVDIKTDTEGVNVNINEQSKVDNKVKKIKENNNNTTIITSFDINENNSENLIIQDYNDSINQEDIKNIKLIKDYYSTYVRNKPLLSSNDISDIETAYLMYPSVKFILETIEIAVKLNINRRGQNTINSFSYFLPILKFEWDTLKRDKEDSENEQQFRGNSNKGYGIDKSKFLCEQ